MGSPDCAEDEDDEPSGPESRVSLRFAFQSRVSRCASFTRFGVAIRCVSLSCLEQELRFGCVSANVRESHVSTAFRCVSPDASSKSCVSGLRFNRAFRPPESHLKDPEPLGLSSTETDQATGGLCFYVFCIAQYNTVQALKPTGQHESFCFNYYSSWSRSF